MRQLGWFALVMLGAAALILVVASHVTDRDSADRPLTQAEMTTTLGTCIECTSDPSKDCKDLDPKGRCVDKKDTKPDCDIYYVTTNRSYNECVRATHDTLRCFQEGTVICYEAYNGENQAAIEDRKCQSQEEGCLEIADDYWCRTCTRGATRKKDDDIAKADEDCRTPT